MTSKQISMYAQDDLTVLNGVVLDTKIVLGIDSKGISRPIQFAGESTLFYSSGPYIVLQDVSTERFLCHLRQDVESKVTLLRTYNDASELKNITGEAAADNFPTLVYREAEISHVLTHKHLPPSDYLIEVAVSYDNSICYTLSHTFLSAWQLNSEQLISYSKVPPGLRNLEALPLDPNKVILGGIGYLKYWNLYPDRRAIEEEAVNLANFDVIEIEIIPKSNILLILCKNKKLLMLEDYKYKTLELRTNAFCMAVTSEECLFGCDGEIDSYMIDKDFQLHFLHIFKLPVKAGTVQQLAYSPNACNAVAMVNCEKNLEVFLVETSEFSITRPFGISLPTKGIKGLSISTGKELVCSYGFDNTVRIWTFSKHCKGIAEQQFAQSPSVAAIHPTGYQIAVGFENSFKVFYLLYNSLSLAFSIGKKCEAAVYSPCGKFLAFGLNNNIAVYDPYTLTSLYHLQGHTGTPQYLYWKKDLLTSVCAHGTVYVWKHTEKLLEFTSADFMVKHALYDETLDLLLCIHVDGDFRVWGDLAVNLVYEANEKNFTSVALCNDLDAVILGMKTGFIRVMLWPLVLPIDNETDMFYHWPVHVGPVTCISMTYSNLFTAGEDSMIICLSAKQVKEGRIKQPVHKKEQEALNNLSLIPQPSLDLQMEKIQQLNDSIKALESDSFDFELEQQEKKYKENIMEMKVSFEKEANKITEDYNIIVEKIMTKNKEFQLGKAEKHSQYTKKIMIQNDKFNKMLNDEFEKFEKLKEEMEVSREKYSEQREEILVAHKEVIEQCEQDYEVRLKKIMEVFNETQKKVQNDKKKFEAIVMQTDADFEEVIRNKVKRQKNEVDDEKRKAREYLGKHAKLIRDNTGIQKDLQQIREKAFEYSEENKNLITEKNSIQEKLKELVSEMKKREEIIKSKETNIKDLRSLHIHLQNYRFVLDQKISSLKDERLPMEEQHKQIQEHIKKLFNELLEEHSTQKETFKLLYSHGEKNVDALMTNQRLREELLSSHNSLNQLYSDLSVLLEEKDNQKLIERLKELYYKHVGKDDIFTSGEPAKPTLNEIFLKEKQENIERLKHEKDQQEHFMQNMYKNMSLNKLTVEDEHTKQILLKQQENAKLIKECYDLRHEKEQLNKKISDLEADIKRIKYSLKGGVVPDQIVKKSIVKDTPFQEYMKKKIVPPQEIYQPKNKPDFRIRSLIFELEKNRLEYAKQNRKFNEILN